MPATVRALLGAVLLLPIMIAQRTLPVVLGVHVDALADIGLLKPEQELSMVCAHQLQSPYKLSENPFPRTCARAELGGQGWSDLKLLCTPPARFSRHYVSCTSPSGTLMHTRSTHRCCFSQQTTGLAHFSAPTYIPSSPARVMSVVSRSRSALLRLSRACERVSAESS